MRQRARVAARDQVTDAELACLAAGGDPAAFEDLYRRHVEAAWRVALAVTSDAEDAADAVSDAFIRVFQALPERIHAADYFRSYLLTAVRNAAIDLLRRGGRQRATDPEDAHDWSVLGSEPAELMVAGTDAALIASAFRSLPQRWRSVLWLTEVEGIPPRDVAALLGVSANGVAQLAVRARAGLRQRYLQAHLRQTEVRALCRDTVARLGAYAAGALAPRDISKVDQHLAGCDTCRSRLEELEDLAPSLRRAVLPLPAGLAAVVLTRWRSASTGASAPSAAASTGASSATVAGATAPGSVGAGVGAAAVGIPASVAASFASVALLVAGIVGVGVVQQRRSDPSADVHAGPSAHFRTSAASAGDGSSSSPGETPLPAGEGSTSVRAPRVAVPRPAPASLPTGVPDVGAPAPPSLEGLLPGDAGVDVDSLPVAVDLGDGSRGCFGVRVLGAHVGCETVTGAPHAAPAPAPEAAASAVATTVAEAAASGEALVADTTEAVSRPPSPGDAPPEAPQPRRDVARARRR